MDEAAFMNQLLADYDSTVPKPIVIPSTVPSTPQHKNKKRVITTTAATHDNSFTSDTSTSTSGSSSTSDSDTSPTIMTATTATTTSDQYDMTAFLEGCEDWDLDGDLLSPVKPKPVAKVSPVYGRMTATASTIAASRPALTSSHLKPSPSARLPSSPTPVIPPYVEEECTRCVAECVEEVREKWQKVVLARVDSTDDIVQVILCHDWFHTDVQPGDIFNVLGSFSAADGETTRSITISSQSNLLILHPDLLLTATALSNAPNCRRKPLLSSLFRSTTDVTPALVWGNILHEVMQKCLDENRWEREDLGVMVDEAISGRLGDLVVLGVGEDVARKEVLERAKGLEMFRERYVLPFPDAKSTLSDTRGGSGKGEALLSITKVLDIEEDIWSPRYGLKGKLDATVQSTVVENKPPSSSSSLNNVFSLPFPLELKTGRSTMGMEHRAQTMLYTLLLSERYRADVSSGLLFYTASESGELVRVPRGRNEVRGLVVVRNELAAWMWKRVRDKKKPKTGLELDADVDMEDQCGQAPKNEEEDSFLPPPIDDERSCQRCYALDTCLLLRKTHGAVSSSNPDPPIPDFLSDIYDVKTGHITPLRAEFFRKWERLLALEERDLVRFKRELWTLGADEREKRGRCFAGMVLKEAGDPSALKPTDIQTPAEELEEGNKQRPAKIHRFTYRFARSAAFLAQKPPSTPTRLSAWSAQADPSQPIPSPSSIPSLLNGHLHVGDPVTISVEPNLLALARGFILELSSCDVVVGVDHAIHLDRIRESMSRGGKAAYGLAEEVIFRIDKDELFGGMGRLRSNLANLFFVGANGIAKADERRLQLIVDLAPPMFSVPSSLTAPSFSSSAMEPLPAFTSSLNPSQRSALGHILSAEDYVLVLGMPGTGKTTVIAQLIRVLVGRGKTVLLTSYTHSAVDNILMRFDDEIDGEGTFGILRIGNVDKVHPDVRKYTLEYKHGRGAKSAEELERRLMAPPVVATTCLSIDHPLFSRRKFDYCIVDEASQITLPTCLGPIRLADKFVLVGDHFQLPPLVKNPEARLGGLDVSLFRLLSQAHPESTVDLKHQYRMNEDIMELSNTLIYDGRLRCGSEEVAKRSLKMPDGGGFVKGVHEKRRGACQRDVGCWLERVMEERSRVVFLDTDNLPDARESRVGDLVENVGEARIIQQIVLTLIKSGISPSSIGLITLYRQQVKLLSHLLQAFLAQGLEIMTADQSQGRDKECIIVSLVRSNEKGNCGDLVRDWRRLNVVFTRARAKLVVVGSKATMGSDEVMKKFFGVVEDRQWVVGVPRGGLDSHLAGLGLGVAQVEEEEEVAAEAEPSAEVKEEVKMEVDVDVNLYVDFLSSSVEVVDVRTVEGREPARHRRRRSLVSESSESSIEFVDTPVPAKKRSPPKRKAAAELEIEIESSDEEVEVVSVRTVVPAPAASTRVLPPKPLGRKTMASEAMDKKGDDVGPTSKSGKLVGAGASRAGPGIKKKVAAVSEGAEKRDGTLMSFWGGKENKGKDKAVEAESVAASKISSGTSASGSSKASSSSSARTSVSSSSSKTTSTSSSTSSRPTKKPRVIRGIAPVPTAAGGAVERKGFFKRKPILLDLLANEG